MSLAEQSVQVGMNPSVIFAAVFILLVLLIASRVRR
jgi:hypothetical protein